MVRTGDTIEPPVDKRDRVNLLSSIMLNFRNPAANVYFGPTMVHFEVKLDRGYCEETTMARWRWAKVMEGQSSGRGAVSIMTHDLSQRPFWDIRTIDFCRLSYNTIDELRSVVSHRRIGVRPGNDAFSESSSSKDLRLGTFPALRTNDRIEVSIFLKRPSPPSGF